MRCRATSAVRALCTCTPRRPKKAGQLEGEIGPEEFLARRIGYTVTDAANRFDKSFRRADLIEIVCNMHARRYFVKALDAEDARAADSGACLCRALRRRGHSRGDRPGSAPRRATTTLEACL